MHPGGVTAQKRSATTVKRHFVSFSNKQHGIVLTDSPNNHIHQLSHTCPRVHVPLQVDGLQGSIRRGYRWCSGSVSSRRAPTTCVYFTTQSRFADGARGRKRGDVRCCETLRTRTRNRRRRALTRTSVVCDTDVRVTSFKHKTSLKGKRGKVFVKRQNKAGSRTM